MRVTIAELRRLEQLRARASLAGDISTLRELLHQDFLFVHSNGRVDTRDTYLDLLASDDFSYARIESSDHRLVSSSTNFGLLLMKISLAADYIGRLLEVEALVLSLWVKDGADWRLLSIQSTPLPSSADAHQ